MRDTTSFKEDKPFLIGLGLLTGMVKGDCKPDLTFDNFLTEKTCLNMFAYLT